MACYTGVKDKELIANTVVVLKDNNVSYVEKIANINMLQRSLGTDATPSTMFEDVKSTYLELSIKFPQTENITLNSAEVAFAKRNKKDQVTSGLLLDGEKYLAIHSAKNIRIFKDGINSVLMTMNTDLTSLKDRNTQIKKELSTELSRQFKSTDENLFTNRNLPNRMVNTNRNQYPLNEDGKAVDKDGKPSIIRDIFKASGNLGLFANVSIPFTNMYEIWQSGAKNKDMTDYENQINSMKEYIPKTVRDILFNKKSEAQTIKFNNDMGMFLETFSRLEVPTEQVWKNNFYMNTDGELVQDLFSLYKYPNYMQILGEFKNKTTTDGKIYQELVLDKNVAEIVKFYSIKAMADMYKLQQEMSGKTDDEIAKALGISLDNASKMRDEFIVNGVMPISSFVNDSAKDAFDQLGLVVNANINMDIKSGLVASLNAMIRATLANSEYMDYVSTPEAVLAEQNQAESLIIKNSGKTRQQALADKATMKNISDERNRIYNKYQFGDKTFSMFRLNTKPFDFKDDNPDAYRNTFAAVNKLQYLSLNEQRRAPSKTKILEVSDYMLKTKYKQTKKIQEFVAAQQKIKWTFASGMEIFAKEYNEHYIDSVDADGKIIENPNKILFLESLGYEVIDGSQHIDGLKKIQSNNDKIERELNTLMGFYESDLSEGFYLPWTQLSNGRAAITSDMNPQESKLIRSLIQQEAVEGSVFDGHTYKMTQGDFITKAGKNSKRGQKRIEMTEYALAQAFDMDPDKLSDKTALQTIRDVVDIRGKGIIYGNSEFAQVIEKLVNDDGTMSFKDKSTFMNYAFGKGEGYHGLQAIRMLQDLSEWKNNWNDGSEFTNELTIETDAITSGMMLTLLGILDSKAIDLLSKGGIYTKHTESTWSKYTKKWLELKYAMNGTRNDDDSIMVQDDINFGPSALIEAGVFHQEVIDNGKLQSEVLMKAKELGIIKEGQQQEFKDNDIDSEVFHDLYKTIGMKMQTEVAAIKVQINIDLAFYEMKTNQLETTLESDEIKRNPEKKKSVERQLAEDRKAYNDTRIKAKMLAQIGDITPKALRKIAKDPAMTYVYGSTIETIRKKLGIVLGKDAFIKAIENVNKILNKDKAGTSKEEIEVDRESVRVSRDFINSVLDKVGERVKPFGKYDVLTDGKFLKRNEDGGIISVKSSELGVDTGSVFNDKYQKLMNLDFDDDFLNVVQEAVNEVFGDPIARAFESTLGNVDAYRDQMKSMELLTFEFFNARMETLKNEELKKGPLTKQGWDRIMEIAAKSGFGHDTIDPAKGIGGALPLTKFDSGLDPKSASVTLTFDKNALNAKDMNAQKRIYAPLAKQHLISNTGGAATTPIHWQDSKIITVTIDANAWLSIYDAVVQASNPQNVDYSNDQYNTNTIVQNSNKDLLGNNLKKLNHMFKNATQKELDFIAKRLASVEEATVKTYTTDKQKYSLGLASNKDNFYEVEINSFDSAIRGYVDVEETIRENGDKTIKEVHWVTKQGTNNKERTILKTTIKVITGYKKEVVDGKEIITYEHMKVTDVYRREPVSFLRDAKEGETKDAFSFKKNKKDMKVKETSDVAYGFMVHYEVNDQETINRINDFENRANKDDDSKPIDMGTMNAQYIELKNNRLQNIISERDEANLGKQDIMPKPTEKETYAPTLHGLDFKSESLRIRLPLHKMIENINKINNTRTNREKNLNQKWKVAHAALPDTKLIEHTNTGIKLKPVDVDSMIKTMKRRDNKNIKHEYKYLEPEIDAISKNITTEQYSNVMKATFDMAEENGVAVEIIGNKASEPGVEVFAKINRHNSGSYDAGSIVGVIPASYTALTKKEKPSSSFKDIDRAIKAGSTIIMESPTADTIKVMDAYGLEATTSNAFVKKAIDNQTAISFKDDEIMPAASLFTMQNYMLNNGYTVENKGSVSVFTKMNIGYNDDIKNKQDLMDEFNKMMMEC